MSRSEHLKSIQSLTINTASFSAEYISTLANAKFDSLTSFKIGLLHSIAAAADFRNIDQAFHKIFSSKMMANIKQLSIEQMNETRLKALFESPQLANLQWLDISGEISLKGLVYINNMKTTKLKGLTLRSEDIKEKAIQLLLDSKKMKTVKVLRLEDAEITFEAIKKILTADNFKELKRFDLEYANIDKPKELAKFLEENPVYQQVVFLG